MKSLFEILVSHGGERQDKVSWNVTTCRLIHKYADVSEERVVSIFRIIRSFVTTMSQLKISEFSGETFKSFEVLRV
jgi:hypothetical protein